MAAYTTIDDSEAFFQCVLWTGDGNDDRNITLPGETDMQPDIVWVKGRQADHSHRFFDAARGATKYLNTATNGTEGTGADTVQAFQSDGFQVGTDGSHNTNTDTYIAWCWKAGGSGSSNTEGSINTTKTSANTTSGVSINTFDGTGANATIGHGIGIKPTVLLCKNMASGSDNWNWNNFSFAALGNTGRIYFNESDGNSAAAAAWNSTAPTSTLVSLGSNGENNGTTMVLYAFAPVQGFSKFGSYLGNSNSDGAFVHTGFSPSLVIVKCTSNASTDWLMVDNKRSRARSSAYNNFMLRANTTAVEENGTVGCDFLSNGFKWRDSENSANVSGRTYTYMAFAYSPFCNSNGVPNNGVASTGGRG